MSDAPRRDLSRVVPSIRHVIRGYALGTGYALFIALLISLTTDRSFWLTLAGLFVAIVAAFVIVLILAVRAALSTRPAVQIRLSSLFLVMALIAIYLSAMRWLAVALTDGSGDLSGGQWTALLVASFVWIFISLPFVLHLGEALMWTAVWLIRQPITQRLIRKRRRRKA